MIYGLYNRLYWLTLKIISLMHLDARYGSGFYQIVSSDLKKILPDVHSFSVINHKNMRYFYEMFPDVGNRQQLVDDLKSSGNRQQLVDDLGKEIIFYIPWGHHVLLLRKCKGDPERALFYVRKNMSFQSCVSTNDFFVLGYFV